MNNSPTFPENLFLSPLLQHQEPSPYLSPFQTNMRKLYEDFSDFISFRLEDMAVFQEINLEESPLAVETCKQQQAASEIQKQLDLDVSNRQEIPSPHVPVRDSVSSTRNQEIHQQPQPPFYQLSPNLEGLPRIQAMINFLLMRSRLHEEKIKQQSLQFAKEGSLLADIFKMLALKFKKLHKTKQEMTKYCMRKAFKYVSENGGTEKGSFDLDSSMRQYFSQSPSQLAFSIPFKKNSAEKTMNGAFLRRIFSCPRFSQDFRIFLEKFRGMLLEDNQKKVRYLAEIICESIQQGHLAKVDRIKRLPWTKEILDETHALAVRLAEHGGVGMGRRVKKNDSV